MAFELTSTGIKPVEGLHVYMPNRPQLHNVIFTSSTATDVLKAGQVVTIDTSSTNTECPVVNACAVTSKPFGVVVYDMRKEDTKVGEKVTIAQSGDTVFMVAGGSFSVGAKLQFNASTRKVDDSTTATNYYIGTAITPASADGDLVQVEINTELGAEPSQA